MGEFSDDQRSRDGYSYWCKPCQADHKRNLRAEDPESVRAVDNLRYQNNKLRIAENNLVRFYGITLAERDAMETSQKGLCASCGNPPSGKGHTAKLFVDHCHTTGKVRGLLCHPCNVALGLLRDDPERIRALLAFVERG